MSNRWETIKVLGLPIGWAKVNSFAGIDEEIKISKVIIRSWHASNLGGITFEVSDLDVPDPELPTEPGYYRNLRDMGERVFMRMPNGEWYVWSLEDNKIRLCQGSYVLRHSHGKLEKL